MADPNYCLWLINTPCQPLDWWTSGAAWAQAILSALAIALSWFISKWQDKAKEKRADDDRIAVAQSLASHLMSSVKELRRNIEATKDLLERSRTMPIDYAPGTPSVPKEIIDAIPQLHKLGKAGSSLLRANYHAGEITACVNVAGYVHDSRAAEYNHRLAKMDEFASEALMLMQQALR
jgi:hypothetical protein